MLAVSSSVLLDASALLLGSLDSRCGSYLDEALSSSSFLLTCCCMSATVMVIGSCSGRFFWPALRSCSHWALMFCVLYMFFQCFIQYIMYIK